MNQTRIVATADGPAGPVTASCMVNSAQLRKATAEGLLGLHDLLAATIRRRGGDPETLELTAEPVGPQIELVAVNGARL